MQLSPFSIFLFIMILNEISIVEAIIWHKRLQKIECKSVFGSLVTGAFQITFRAKMQANDVFSFFKNHF
jgi:hypothetical protein